MHLDARKLKDGVTLEADVCIVGSGPAGISLALELLTDGRNVVILESGGRKKHQGLQALNTGDSVGDPYAGLQETRHRQVGGAPNIWNTPVLGGLGAKYVPLDPWDFQSRPDASLSGWPFDLAHLEPFYRRAQAVCGLGPFAYGARSWTSPERPALSLESPLRTAVYQFGSREVFLRRHLRTLGQAPDFRLYSHATTTGLLRRRGSARITGMQGVSSTSGVRFSVEAGTVVLAAGAVENARILLLCDSDSRRVPGNAHGWVGRCFMEHPRDFSMHLAPRSRRLFAKAGFYDAHEAQDGTVIGGRLALDEEACLVGGLPNASITLLPKIRERHPWIEWAIRFWLCPHSAGRRGFGGGYGWSSMKDPGRWLEGFKLVLNMEQRPDPENRLVLSEKRDTLGRPRAELHWRWTREEQVVLDRLRDALAGAMERSGLGRVVYRPGLAPDPNACHHAGTTRMHESPEGGVVDPDGRVHGTENLYVTGASVFPTAGFANPTLTIVAMALRLGDHLRMDRELRGVGPGKV